MQINYVIKSGRQNKSKNRRDQQRKQKDGECELALHGFQREAKIEVLQSLLEKE